MRKTKSVGEVIYLNPRTKKHEPMTYAEAVRELERQSRPRRWIGPALVALGALGLVVIVELWGTLRVLLVCG